MSHLSAAERLLKKTARVILAVFSPYYIAFIAFLALFLFSYLSVMPSAYKLLVLGIVYCFTILIPDLTVFLFRKINRYTPDDLLRRGPRLIKFFFHLLPYGFSFVIMRRLNIPWYMTGILLTYLLLIIVCMAVNIKWRMSEHMAGVGSVIGGLVAFSVLFGFNPLWWLCLAILASGLVGTALMSLEHHTLAQTLVGFAVGAVGAMTVLHPFYNGLFRFLLF